MRYIIYAEGLSAPPKFTQLRGPDTPPLTVLEVRRCHPPMLTFGDALVALHAGMRVQRRGWQEDGRWLALAVGVPDEVQPCITQTADGKTLTGWCASQADMLSDDWTVVP